MQSQAFVALANSALPDAARAALCAELASAAAGMCAGKGTGHRRDRASGRVRHRVAGTPGTVAGRLRELLRASLRMGAIAAGADAASRAALDRFADALGLAFQVRDDLLDVEGESATLGKTAGKDAARAKPTFPALIGIEASRARLDALADDMREALSMLAADTSALAALGRMAIERDR
ncbi:MAG: polyprenyl synthetase family protein [Lysobacterales bacterium]